VKVSSLLPAGEAPRSRPYADCRCGSTSLPRLKVASPAGGCPLMTRQPLSGQVRAPTSAPPVPLKVNRGPRMTEGRCLVEGRVPGAWSRPPVLDGQRQVVDVGRPADPQMPSTYRPSDVISCGCTVVVGACQQHSMTTPWGSQRRVKSL